MTLDLNAVMDAIGVRLNQISGLRVYDYLAESAAPPAAIVGLPADGEYDVTKDRGCDRAVVPVTVLVGKVSDRASRDALAGYVAGTGDRSVKAAVEADGVLAGAAKAVQVKFPAIDIVTLGTVDYLGAVFDVEVFA